MTVERKPPVIGLVGPIASGKSSVARLLKERGAAIIDADRIGHEVLKQPEVCREARARWGDAIFAEGGAISRPALARIVFGPEASAPGELAHLEQITHGRIGQIVRQEMARLAAETSVAAIVLDAPVMFKAGWNQFCDKIVKVDAPRPLRRARARDVRGWTEEEFARREAAQQSPQALCQHADWVVNNSGSPEALEAQIERAWPSLMSAGPP